MLIDIHAHLNDEKLFDNAENIILHAKEVGVEKIVCAASDYKASKLALKLAEKYKNIYATIGLHPNNCLEFNKEMEDLILSAKDNKKVVAIGEIGLDYYDLDYQIIEAIEMNPKYEKIDKTTFIEKQKEVFLKQIELAHKINLPIMIHMRDSTNDTLKVLEGHKNLITNGGLLHCYNGNIETTKKVFDLGFYISLGGAITFKNSKNMPEILREIGLERVTLETDCPYLSPEPYRGKINEPKNIPLIANKIAEITGTNLSYVEKITTENCYKVFNRLKDSQ